MKNKYFKILMFFATIASIQGCIKRFEFDKLTKTQWSPDFAVPLVNSNLTLLDILNHYDSTRSIVQEDPDGFLTLAFKGELLSLKASDIVDLSDQNLNFDVDIPIQVLQALQLQDSVELNINQVIDFNFQDPNNPEENVLLDSVLFNGGNLSFRTNPNFQVNGDVTMSLNSAYNQQGNNIVIKKGLEFGATSQDLRSSKMIANINGDKNKLPLSFRIVLRKNQTQVINNAKIEFGITLQAMSFKSLYGYIYKRFLTPDTDTINMEAFSKLFKEQAQGATQFKIEDPKLKFIFENSYGLPVKCDLNGKVVAYYPADGTPNANQSVNISLGPLDNPIIVDGPSVEEIGSSKRTEISLNKNNSGINTITDYITKFMTYRIDTETNPNGLIVTNFMTDESILTLNVEAEIPLEGYAINLRYTDTLDFAFDYDQVQNLSLRLIAENGFPADITMNFIPVDENFQPILYADGTQFRLFTAANQSLFLKGGLVGADGKVNFTEKLISDYVISEEGFQLLKKTKFIIYEGDMNTSNGTNSIKIYSDYGISIKMGAILGAKL